MAVGRIWIMLTVKATTFYVKNNGEAKAFIIGRWGQVCFHLKIMPNKNLINFDQVLK